jgi:hypothetical protein
VEASLLDGVLANILPAEMVHRTDNFMKLAKLPFLLWCMHPMTLGSELIARNVLGNLTRLVSITKGTFVTAFSVLVGAATL